MRFPSAHSCHPQQRGFTLLEVLIAVTITAVIGLGVWQVINGVVNSRDRVNELAEQFDGLQRSMLLLERDIMQVVNRPARDIYGDFQPALSSRADDFSLLLTRQGWRNPWAFAAVACSVSAGNILAANCGAGTGRWWIRARKMKAATCCCWKA